ncbi:MAG: hypothetical protein ACE5GX_20620, partial [Thermoanaerobaculia bacterium]
ARGENTTNVLRKGWNLGQLPTRPMFCEKGGTSVSYPPAPAVIALAQALHVSTDELLGVKDRKPDPREHDAELRRLWKKFQRVGELPERDQRAVIRLINSLASAADSHSAAAG